MLFLMLVVSNYLHQKFGAKVLQKCVIIQI